MPAYAESEDSDDMRSHVGSTISTIVDDMRRNAGAAPVTYEQLKQRRPSSEISSITSPRRERSVSGATIEGFLEKRGAWLVGYSNRYCRVFSGGTL
eukprot:6061818-Prymnesium_polylepis.1